MTNATYLAPLFDTPLSATPCSRPERARYDAFFAEWFPRLYRLAAARLGERARAEAATRAALVAAIRAGLVGAQGGVAPRLLAIAHAEIARARRAHGFVT